MTDETDGGGPHHDPPALGVDDTHAPAESGATTLNGDLSFDVTRTLPEHALSSGAIERLRTGGTLSQDEIETLRAAVLADSGMVGRFLGGLLSSGLAVDQKEPVTVLPSGLDIDEDRGVHVVPIGGERFAWSWKRPSPTESAKLEPATYYEALTGKPDPMRGFFVTGRRVLSVVTWIIALGLPVGLVALGTIIGESPDTVFFMALFGLVVGMMIKSSFPKTPFD